MDRISEYLYEKETITGKEFMKIFREMKGLPDPEEEKKDASADKSAEVMSEENPVDTQVADVIYVEPESDADIAKSPADTNDGKDPAEGDPVSDPDGAEEKPQS